MKVQVISPDRQIFNGEITQAIMPGVNGGFEILKDHAPLISILGKGMLTLNTTAEGEKTYQIDGGVIEVVKNEIRILVESIV
jgi:F-type H+-transporting ATPase subunit epsilon